MCSPHTHKMEQYFTRAAAVCRSRSFLHFLCSKVYHIAYTHAPLEQACNPLWKCVIQMILCAALVCNVCIYSTLESSLVSPGESDAWAQHASRFQTTYSLNTWYLFDFACIRWNGMEWNGMGGVYIKSWWCCCLPRGSLEFFIFIPLDGFRRFFSPVINDDCSFDGVCGCDVRALQILPLENMIKYMSTPACQCHYVQCQWKDNSRGKVPPNIYLYIVMPPNIAEIQTRKF